MVFLSIEVYCHIDSGYNTSFVGNNRNLIEDLFRISIRIKEVAEDFMMKDKEAAQAAMGHHIYHYNWLSKSFLWRIPYYDIIHLLEDYPPYSRSGDRLVDFVGKHPRLYAMAAQIVRPFLLLAWKLKNKLR